MCIDLARRNCPSRGYVPVYMQDTMALRTPLRLGLAFIVIAAVASFALSIWLTSSDSGKEWVKGRLETLVTSQIPGRLRVGRIVDLGPPLVAEDVRFYHPDGRVVLIADHAEIEPDLSQALRGRLGFARAAVDGGRLVLSPDPDGRIAIEAALDAKAKPGEPSDPHGGLHYALQSMHVQNFRVETKLSDLADFKVDDVEGFVAVRRIETSGTVVELDRVSGRVTPGFLGKKTVIEQLDGWVHGKQKHAAQFNAEVAIGDGALHAKLDVHDREKAPVEVEIKHSRGAGDLAATAVEFADGLFGDTLEVKSKD
jgi:hypothetical protein